MKKLILLLPLLAIMFTGCIGPFYESDFGKYVKLPVGTPFEVRLEGNPSSDYIWQLSGLDTNVVRMVLRPVFKPFNEERNSPGIYSFYFQTVGEGKTQLEMIYANQVKDEEVEKTFSMEVESKI